MGKRFPFSHRVSLGGVCFELSAADHPLFPDSDASYRPFVLNPGAPDDGEAIAVRVCVADIRPPEGRLLFASGSWSIFSQGNDRCLVLWPPSLPNPFCEIRFRPGSPEIAMVCAPRFLESRDGVVGIRSQFRYPLDQVLTMYLLREKGLILHAAGFVVGGRGVVMPGISGAGKSTITRLSAGVRDVRALSDDRVILRVRGGDVVVHGTPWPGEAGVAEHLHTRVSHLLFLEKGDHNGVRAITQREALARLLPTVSIPWYDAEHVESGLRACDAVSGAVPTGIFTFREETGAVEALEAFLAEP